MKVLVVASVVVPCTLAFTLPSSRTAFGVSRALQSAAILRMSDDSDTPFFAKLEETDLDQMTEEEEVEAMVQEEISKTKRMSNLRNEKGVDYAPWMGISEEDEVKIRQLMKEKAAARRARKEQELNVSGNLLMDSQAQELSGTGLKHKIIDGNVELEWGTNSETNTRGFVVKRRPARTDTFEVIASYESFAPLTSKGESGGAYRFLDSTVDPGGWVYRVAEVDSFGTESDICQCLVEVQTEGEQKAALIAGVGISVVGILAVAAGMLVDPLGGY